MKHLRMVLAVVLIALLLATLAAFSAAARGAVHTIEGTPTPTAEGGETPTPTADGGETPTPTADTETPTPTAEGGETPTPTAEGGETPTPTAEGGETPDNGETPDTETPTPDGGGYSTPRPATPTPTRKPSIVSEKTNDPYDPSTRVTNPPPTMAPEVTLPEDISTPVPEATDAPQVPGRTSSFSSDPSTGLLILFGVLIILLILDIAAILWRKNLGFSGLLNGGVAHRQVERSFESDEQNAEDDSSRKNR